MSQTAHIKIVNVQMVAEEQVRQDIANGTFDKNLVQDSRYYLLHSEFQTIPVGLDGNAENYVRLLKAGLPEANTLRMGFNEHSFNSDGSLSPEFEKFLQHAAAVGYQFIFVYHSDSAQRFGGVIPASVQEFRDALSGNIYQGIEQGWTKMLDWLDVNPTSAKAVYGLELINEPATYARAQMAAGETGEFVRLYADHVAELSNMLGARSDTKVLVGGWAYSAQFNIFAETAYRGTTVLEKIRESVGGDLVWSSHIYPRWFKEGTQTREQFSAALDEIWGALGNDDILLTETNAAGFLADDPLQNDIAFHLVRSWNSIIDRGVGIGWFQGLEAGASNLAVIDAAGSGAIRYLHPASLAHALNAYSMSEPQSVTGQQTLLAELYAGRVRSDDTLKFFPVDGLGLAFGYDGDDQITGRRNAINMLYGGTGNDEITGSAHTDYLFGGAGNDILRGLGGNDISLGGDGDDTLFALHGDNSLTGGAGADTFRLAAGTNVVTDFKHNENDVLVIDGEVYSGASIFIKGVSVDYDGDGFKDDVIIDTGVSETILLDYNAIEADGIVKGGLRNDLIDHEYVDIDRDRLLLRGSRVEAGAGADRVIGRMGNDTISGNTGNDHLVGRGGDDDMRGGDGNDLIFGNGGDDTMTGGNGADVIQGAWGADKLFGGAGNDLLSGGLDADSLHGGTGADTLMGESGDDLLAGNEGHDRIFGGAGHDKLLGGANNDYLSGGAGNDRVYGEVGDDTLIGGPGHDTLKGGAGADWLVAGGGRDLADGGAGDDRISVILTGGDQLTLYGGNGSDTFVFHDWNDGYASVILFPDFDPKIDQFFIAQLGAIDKILLSDESLELRQIGENVHLIVENDRYVFLNTQVDMFT